MKLQFTVNENFLIYRILLAEEAEDENIIALQNKAWDFSEHLYNLAIGRPAPSEMHDVQEFQQIPKFFEFLKNTSEYKTIQEKTEVHKQECEQTWNASQAISTRIVKELTGYDLSSTFSVSVVHPALGEGRYLGNGEIVWGHDELWKNYAVVYLWHEVLHEYLGYSERRHAVIQLIADNELRRRLGGPEYPPFAGHPDLFPIMDEQLLHWQEYLHQKPKARDFSGFLKIVS